MSSEHYVIGKRAVQEVFKKNSSVVKKLFIKQSTTDATLKSLANSFNDVKYLTNFELTNLVGSSNHQGIVAVITNRTELNLKQILEQSITMPSALILLLDGIQDPNNFGSIIRAAECFGVAAILYTKSKSVGLTATVSKVSAGASELLPTLAVGNLAETIKLIKHNKFWIVSADNSKDAADLNQFNFPSHTALVLGSESKGARHLINERSDFLVKIKMYGQIDSLNVGQAAAVFMYAYRNIYKKTL